jgi:hypothetical protein
MTIQHNLIQDWPNGFKEITYVSNTGSQLDWIFIKKFSSFMIYHTTYI